MNANAVRHGMIAVVWSAECQKHVGVGGSDRIDWVEHLLGHQVCDVVFLDFPGEYKNFPEDAFNGIDSVIIADHPKGPDWTQRVLVTVLGSLATNRLTVLKEVSIFMPWHDPDAGPGYGPWQEVLGK